MLHSDLFPEFGCDGELIELPERCTQVLTVTQCAKWELAPMYFWGKVFTLA